MESAFYESYRDAKEAHPFRIDTERIISLLEEEVGASDNNSKIFVGGLNSVTSNGKFIYSNLLNYRIRVHDALFQPQILPKVQNKHCDHCGRDER